MSVNQPFGSTDDGIRITKPKASNQRPSTAVKDTIDRRLKHLKEEVLPIYPFLLTVPTDVPFRLGSRFINNWAVSSDGPFSPEEQQLQYMTFLTHHEGDSLLVAVGDWSDGTGNVMSDLRPDPQSAASTPSNRSIKKISLNDYKNKRKTSGTTSPVGQEANNHTTPTTYVVADTHRIPKVDPIGNNLQRKSNKFAFIQPSSGHTLESTERKRCPEPENENSRPQERKEPRITHQKKPRLSPTGSIEPKTLDRSKANELPTLLSPTLPPTTNSPRLPRLLSPTLPPDLEKELARLEGNPPQQKRNSSAELVKVRSKQDRPLNRSTQVDSTPTISRQGSNGKYLNSTSDRNATASPPVIPESHGTPKTSLTYQTNSKASSLDASVRQQLVVKLKYGRSNRKRVEALLKFSGKKKQAPPNSPVRDPVDPELSQTMKVEQNVMRIPAPDRSSSRSHRVEGRTKLGTSTQSIVSLSEGPRDPKLSIPEKVRTSKLPISDSALHQQGRASQALVASGRDLGVSMTRSETGCDSKTPFSSVVKNTVAEAVATAKLSPLQSSGQPTVQRNSDRRAWKDEYQKYGNLGRELKHAAERHTAKDTVTGADEKLAVATAIEAILCFILAFVADDQSKTLPSQAGDSSSWLSILAYWRVVKKNSISYPHLHSLCSILGAVSYDAIHSLDLERLAITPLPRENTPAQAPLSDESSALIEESRRNRKEIQELKNRLPEYYRESQRLWLEGLRGLSEDVLAREFPSTWSKRSRNFSEQGRQQLKVGDFSGEFFLPLGRANSPVETVRFGYEVLKEWCTKEGVVWRGLLNL